MRLSRRHLLATAPAAPAAARHAAAQAAAWSPDRPVRIIVPYTPGASNDLLARFVGEGMQAQLGHPGVVENRPGASGSLGIAAVAQGPADGSLIAVANTANLTMNPFLFANTGYDPVRDLAPLCVVARVMNALVVRAADGPRDVQALIAQANARPGQLSYASSGAGSSPHLAAELLKHRTGTDITHVPYRGSAPGLADLMGGRVDMAIDNLPNTLPHVQSGRLRALAVTGAERDPTMPDVPTFAEAGIRDVEVHVWFGFVGPAGLPPAIRDRLSEAIIRTARTPETAERILRAGARVWIQDQRQMAALIREELEKWGAVIRAANIKVE
jgi:tripartite-type tricarboxylate transporter receptor subunit TctC